MPSLPEPKLIVIDGWKQVGKSWRVTVNVSEVEENNFDANDIQTFPLIMQEIYLLPYVNAISRLKQSKTFTIRLNLTYTEVDVRGTIDQLIDDIFALEDKLVIAPPTAFEGFISNELNIDDSIELEEDDDDNDIEGGGQLVPL